MMPHLSMDMRPWHQKWSLDGACRLADVSNISRGAKWTVPHPRHRKNKAGKDGCQSYMQNKQSYCVTHIYDIPIYDLQLTAYSACLLLSTAITTTFSTPTDPFAAMISGIGFQSVSRCTKRNSDPEFCVAD